MAAERTPPSFGYLAELALLLLLATLWGASYTFIKLGVESIPPVTFIAARTAIAAVLLLGVLHWRRIAMPAGLAVWRRFLFQACLNNVIPFTLIAWAEQSLDAGLATILNSSAPIFTFSLAWCLRREQSATDRQLLGVIFGMVGICLIVGVQGLYGVGQQLTAELAIVAATVCYAGAAIFGRHFQGLDPMLPATGSLLCGAIVLIPISLVLDRPWTLAPSSRSIFALICLSVFSTALALTIYFRLIRTLGSVGTTAQAYLRVPIGVAIGVAFLGESLARTTSIGLVCVIAGVTAMTIQPRTWALSRYRPVAVFVALTGTARAGRTSRERRERLGGCKSGDQRGPVDGIRVMDVAPAARRLAGRVLEDGDTHAGPLEPYAGIELVPAFAEWTDPVVVGQTPQPRIERIATPELVCAHRRPAEFNAGEVAHAARVRNHVVQEVLPLAPAEHSGDVGKMLEEQQGFLDETGTEEAPVVLAMEDEGRGHVGICTVDALHLPAWRVIDQHLDPQVEHSKGIPHRRIARVLDNQVASDRRGIEGEKARDRVG
jgi:drug/metabolite transporter (DMT)-like permease